MHPRTHPCTRLPRDGGKVTHRGARLPGNESQLSTPAATAAAAAVTAEPPEHNTACCRVQGSKSKTQQSSQQHMLNSPCCLQHALCPAQVTFLPPLSHACPLSSSPLARTARMRSTSSPTATLRSAATCLTSCAQGEQQGVLHHAPLPTGLVLHSTSLLLVLVPPSGPGVHAHTPEVVCARVHAALAWLRVQQLGRGGGLWRGGRGIGAGAP